MRADRLLSLLMLLQTRGRMTAQALAAELEVSVRTIYRDMDALSAAGVPVYADAGPGGGCALLDDYRTNLTGLREDEARAFFMLSIPSALADLGFGADLKEAMLKLTAALPAAHSQEEAWVRQRIYLDWAGWAQTTGPSPHLHTLQQAIWADQQVTIRYRRGFGSFQTTFERVVDPYGLVAKAGAWYLVCAVAGRLRVYAMTELEEVTPSNKVCIRSPGFDLSSFWRGWCEKAQDQRKPYEVVVRATLACAQVLEERFGAMPNAPTQDAHESETDGFCPLALRFRSIEDARSTLLGFGGAGEVLAPEPLRLSLADFAQQILKTYTQRDL
ncbi:MAG: WYL domain-containing protein [Anaerolineales bacterium]|nr:WYL domain-containing protein [Anaerolineales bacterium]